MQARVARQITALQEFDQQHLDRKEEIVAGFRKAKGEEERDKIWDSPIFKPSRQVQGKVKGKEGRLEASGSDDRKRTLREMMVVWETNDDGQDMHDLEKAREYEIGYEGRRGRRG